jgi:indole-3-glycerol phosphate synthase
MIGGRFPKMCRTDDNRTGSEVQSPHAIPPGASAADRRWTPPAGALGALVETSRGRAAAVLAEWPALRARAGDQPPPPAFAAALRRSTVAVIAEIKRSSPSKGALAPDLAAGHRARAYEAGGAAALSVLTEPSRFGGSLADLADVAAAVSIPVLRKDFVVHPVQLWEARAHGAAAVLLIARALPPASLAALHAEAAEAGLEVLVEVRDGTELARAIAIGATVIGINNRDLESLVIEPATAPALLPAIPAGCIAVAESGFSQPADAGDAIEAGADALLVGSALSLAADPIATVAAFARLLRRAAPRTA